MIKLLAVDMDGTCLNSDGKMSDNTLNSLKKAAESGIIVVPTTGRNTKCLPVKIKNETFYRYVVSSNGSLVVDLETDEEIFSALIDCETAERMAKEFRKHLILIGAHIERGYCVQGRILRMGVKHFLGDDAPEIKCVRNMAKTIKKEKKPVEEFQLFYKGEKYRDIIKKIIEPYPDITAAFSKDYAEIYHKAGSKGTALLALGERLGITPDEIVCIGDEENDISMFDMMGHPFAMGNAIDAVKERAERVLPTNNEDGVAYAVYNYILK